MSQSDVEQKYIGWMADRLAAKSTMEDGSPWPRDEALEFAKQVFDGFEPRDRGDLNSQEDAYELVDTEMSYWEGE